MAKHAVVTLTISCSAAASAAQARMTGSCARHSSSHPSRLNQFRLSRDLCHPIRRPIHCHPESYPIIGPELATYGVVQPMARQLGLDTLGTLHERVGDTLTLENAGGSGTGWGRADWARFFGQQVNNRYQAFADPRADGWLGGFQGGLDLWRGSFLPGHRDAAGVYLAYGHADIQVNGLVTNTPASACVLTHTGTVNLDAYSAAAYWTHYGPSGWYVDAVLQGTRYGGSAMTQFAQLPTNGYGFISSLETGYPVPLPLGPRFVLEPQAQIIWQQVTLNQANDGEGPVALGSTSGATGRIGVRGQWTIVGENGQIWQPYARAISGGTGARRRPRRLASTRCR